MRGQEHLNVKERIAKSLFFAALFALQLFAVSVVFALIARPWSGTLLLLMGRLFLGYVVAAVVGGVTVALLAPLTRSLLGALTVGALVGVVSVTALTLAVVGDTVRYDAGLRFAVLVAGSFFGSVGAAAIRDADRNP